MGIKLGTDSLTEIWKFKPAEGTKGISTLERKWVKRDKHMEIIRKNEFRFWIT